MAWTELSGTTALVTGVTRGFGPEHVGKPIADLASSTDQASGTYLLTPDGLSLVP